jgi:hypothetical protein
MKASAWAGMISSLVSSLTRPVGAQPDLETGQQLALQPDQVAGGQQQCAEHHTYFDQ